MRVVATGINGKMNEMQAALGLLQLQHINEALAQRQAIDARYRKAIQDIPGLSCVPLGHQSVANYAYFPILVGDDYSLARDELYEQLKAQGIHGRRYFYPLISEFPMYRGLESAKTANLPVAADAAARVICLPIYPDLDLAQVDRIVAMLREPHACD